MMTEKQLMANRRNATLSTGPRTAEGKGRSSENAVVHGLTSQDLLIDGEKLTDLAPFRDAMLQELAPNGELEGMLAHKVISGAWRLQRASRYERYIVECEMDNSRLRRAEFPGLEDRDPRLDLQAAVLKMLNNKTYERLSRYEAHIEQGMYKALHELQRLQAADADGRPRPPAALDVTVSSD